MEGGHICFFNAYTYKEGRREEIIERRLEKGRGNPEGVKIIGEWTALEGSGGYMIFEDGNEGITSITIFQYDKAKAGEASEAIANGYMIFFGVPGFRYSLRLASGAAATMKMMGLE